MSVGKFTGSRTLGEYLREYPSVVLSITQDVIISNGLHGRPKPTLGIPNLGERIVIHNLQKGSGSVRQISLSVKGLSQNKISRRHVVERPILEDFGLLIGAAAVFHKAPHF